MSWEPVFVVLVVAAAAAYLWFARDDRPDRRHAVCFAVGLVLIGGSLNSPLETWASQRLLMIHLLQNALIADIAPLFLLLGLTPKMRAAMPQIRARYALPTWLIAWYGTHAANFYDWALKNTWPLQIEHAILIAGGLLFWWPLVSRRLGPPAALAYLGVGFVGSSFLGLALIFSTRPLYTYYEHTQRMWGLSPVRDQNLGGILMNGEQTIVFLVAIGYYIIRLLDEENVSAALHNR